MHVLNVAEAAGSGRSALRALAVVALLSSPWLVASAAPVLSGSPATSIIAAHYYAFQPGAMDSVGKKVTFSITNKPSWAVFNATTGRLAGTPLPPNVGTFFNIVISGSDGTASTHLAPFAVTVLPLPNNPPRIGGSPTTAVVAGHAYAFQPNATDPNGLSMKFGISGKPAWAAFDTNTGRLSGTPATASSGTYANIVIAAYDGYMKGVLPAFSIVVQADSSTPTPVPPPVTTTAAATVSWIPPTVNTDGSVLGNLAGYYLYYGTSPDNLNQSVTVTNAGLTRYVLSGLAKQTWYFAMTAYNSIGVESGRTAVKPLAVQ
jgi:hypothetical protein